MQLPRRNRPIEEFPPLEALHPSTIALLQLGKLGDMILTTPLLHALRELYPDTHLTVIASEATAILPQSLSCVNTVIAVPRGLLRQLPALTTRLRNQRFDLYIDIKDHRSTTSRMIGELLRATRTIAHQSAIAGKLGATALPHTDSHAHYVDRALAVMSLLAPGRAFDRRPAIEIPLAAYRAVDDQLDPGQNGMVVVNISAGDQSRYWQASHWKKLIAHLAGRYSVAVLCSPGDRPLADEICAMRKGIRPIRTETILEAAAVVDRARFLVSPDTSIIHLASARNRPCVGLYPFSDTNVAVFGPLSDRHSVVKAPENGTVADISYDDVLRAITELDSR